MLIAQTPQNIGFFDGIGGYLPTPLGKSGGAASTLNILFTNIFGFFTVAAGLTFLVYFIIGAVSWITAGGSQDKVDSAKKYMTNAAIGLIIMVASYGLISVIGTVLGLDILNPGSLFADIIERSFGIRPN